MVLTAFRGADSMVAASAVVVPHCGAPAQVQRDAPALDHTMVVPSALFEVDSSAFSENGSSRHREELSEGFVQSISATDHDYAETEDSHLPGQPSAFTGSAVDSAHTGASPVEDQGHKSDVLMDPEPRFGGVPPVYDRIQEEDMREAARIMAAFINNTAMRDKELPREEMPGQSVAQTGQYRIEDPMSIGEEAVTDRLEAPLPAWDYSHSEWPVLVGPSPPRSFKELRSAIAAVVLLACATGFYFLIYRPFTPTRRTATDSGTTARVAAVEPRAAAAGSADSDALAQAAPTPSDTAAGAASPPAETVFREAVASNDDSAQGRFSLQAAAFPTLGGADEFAEKLKRAGVPSYVLPADLARRGRWFRVRVGRFNSAEDAQRFAGEAQQRARAGGLTVQLIVCQYDQP
ncbi:MAG TPA: SPOR domain-containing protein [Blastocatellia bacterium]|nr:SPOR domain-containing protein [Blastocatellia bacterium]